MNRVLCCCIASVISLWRLGDSSGRRARRIMTREPMADSRFTIFLRVGLVYALRLRPPRR